MKDRVKEIMQEAWKERGRNMDTECTCNDCQHAKECPYAFDLYNSGSDCLAMK